MVLLKSFSLVWSFATVVVALVTAVPDAAAAAMEFFQMLYSFLLHFIKSSLVQFCGESLSGCCFVSRSRAHAMLADRITALLPVTAMVALFTVWVHAMSYSVDRSEFVKCCYSIFSYSTDGSAWIRESTYNGEYVR